MRSSPHCRRAVIDVVPLMLVAGLLWATYAWCCPNPGGGGVAPPSIVESGLVDVDTAGHDAAVAPTGGDPTVRAWTEDRAAGARAAALVGVLLALAVPGPRPGLAALLQRRGRPCAARRRHSISLRAPPLSA